MSATTSNPNPREAVEVAAFAATSNRRTPRSASALRVKILTVIVLSLGTLVVFVPFYWMVSTSLKKQGDVFLYPPQWVPTSLQWVNYSEVFDVIPVLTFAKNSGIVVGGVVIGTLLSCSFSAYGFARLRAPGRDFVFILVLATLMLPSVVTLVPTYIAFNKIGWIDSFKPLIVPAFFGSPFYLFLLRQFYLSIPRELEESARLDGASSFRIWWNIMLPLSKPALATVAVFSFFASYNDFFGPLIYLNDESKRTLAVALSYFVGAPQAGPQTHLLMAVATLSIIPSLVVFLFAQRYFVRSIVTSGIKG